MSGSLALISAFGRHGKSYSPCGFLTLYYGSRPFDLEHCLRGFDRKWLHHTPAALVRSIDETIGLIYIQRTFVINHLQTFAGRTGSNGNVYGNGSKAACEAERSEA